MYSTDLQFAEIPPGTCLVPCMESNLVAKAFTVRVTKPFKISKYLITRGQWREFMGEYSFSSMPLIKSDDQLCPATGIGRSEVDLFLKKISKVYGKTFSLPTCAQWLLACSGGTRNPAYWATSDHEIANEERTAQFVPVIRESWRGEERDRHRTVRKIGQYPTNPFGLYDMVGIASHWVQDRYDMSDNAPYPDIGSYPPAGAQVDDYYHDKGNCGVVCGCGYGSRVYDYMNLANHVLRPAHGPGDIDGSFRIIVE